MRLSSATLAQLPAEIARPAYDRATQKTGIVHFGIGGFHRAHQAWYTDACMNAGERDWMISGVSLRSATVADQLNPQDGLYSLTERSGDQARTRIVGAVREVLMAKRDASAIVARLAAPECRIASFTVTEKGYCRGEDGSLDLAPAEASFYPLLAAGLAARMAAGLPGLTLLCCDNLADNGRELARLLGEWCLGRTPELGNWIARECAFPSTMVDRIVPATTCGDLDRLEAALGLRDEGAVLTERFSQWVIEDAFAGPRPGWENHGAQLVPDAAPYETAKLRMLNGAHSALAYRGLERGHMFVHEAIADPSLRALVDRLMLDEAAASITPAEGQDLAAYARRLTARFADRALNHRLSQIAIDGSQKIPQRWLPVLAFHQREGRQCPAILEALTAWLRHVRGDVRAVDDPLATRLAALWASEGHRGVAPALFGAGGLFAQDWQASEEALGMLERRLGED